MTQKKLKRPANKLRAIKGNPMFRKRIEKNKKGKGSYQRKKMKAHDCGKSVFTENIFTTIMSLLENRYGKFNLSI